MDGLVAAINYVLDKRLLGVALLGGRSIGRWRPIALKCPILPWRRFEVERVTPRDNERKLNNVEPNSSSADADFH